MRSVTKFYCQTLDVLLWSCFTAEELEQLAAAQKIPVRRPAGLEPHVAVMVELHRLCRERGNLAEKLESLLDQRHDAALEWVESGEPQELNHWCRGPLERLPYSPESMLWAIARQEDPDYRTCESILTWRMSVEGIRRLTFGHVELIAV